MTSQDQTPVSSRPSVPIIGVGASAGGLEALRELFSGRDGGTTGMAFVVIQHLDPNHESLMAQLIERYTAMQVMQASGGETVEADHIYVIPPGHGLSLRNGRLLLTEFTDPRGLRRPIDDFFEALALDAGPLAACVILSGTGADGTRGLRAIKEHGGLCVVQDPKTAGYDGMPTSAIGTGLADFVCAPSDILDTLHRFFEFAEDRGDADTPRAVFDYISEICDTLADALGHDFSAYKRSTLSRRIARRMQVLGLDNPRAYRDRVRSDVSECTALFHDLLINVTRFFRDREEFDQLAQLVIGPLVANCPDDEELRIWVPGCSSGEEAYSIAMLVHEEMRKTGRQPFVQIFATDIDGKMLDIARAGTYPLSALPDIPEALRNRYTVAGNSSFSVTQPIRDMVRFSMHSLIKDPPFAKIDLISCRNLLIYFDESLQREVVPLLHFALREDGFLFLGSSEAIGRFEDLFRIENQGARLFRRGRSAGRYSLRLPKGRRASTRSYTEATTSAAPQPRSSLEDSALRRLAEGFAPVSLVVDEGGNLLHRFGALSKFLDFPDRLDRNIHVPSLAKPGLREVIGGLIREAGRENRRLMSRDVQVDTGLGTLPCDVLCEPMDDGAILVVLRESGPLAPQITDGFDEVAPEDGHLRYLEQELQSTRHRLSTTVEELETTNEELKSSNEEMMSMNEELQSTNEELTTVNDELKTKVDQLTVANADLSNFFNSTRLVVVVVDGAMCIRNFTEAAAELFDLDSSRIGRRFNEVVRERMSVDLFAPLEKAATEAETSEFRVHSHVAEKDFVARVLPYKRQDGSFEGATLVMTDVTRALELEKNLDEERQRLRLALEVARIGVWEYDPETDATVVDATERELLDLGPDEGDRMEPILARLTPEDRDRVNLSLRQAMNGTLDFNEVFGVQLRSGGVRWLHGMGRRYGSEQNQKFIGVTYDITPERDLLDQRELMIREMNHRVKNLFAIVSALISISSRETESVHDFASALRARVRSLAESHALTNSGAAVKNATLQEVISTVLAPSRSGQQISIDGPEVEIATAQLTSLALILHEWGTNSTKYGALSVADGRIDVNIALSGGQVTLEWIETGHSTETPDGNGGNGFGTSLVDATALQLKAEVTGERTEHGYVRRLVFPCEA